MSKGEKFVKGNVLQTPQQRERGDIMMRKHTINKTDKEIGKVKTRTKTTWVGRVSREDVKTKKQDNFERNTHAKLGMDATKLNPNLYNNVLFNGWKLQNKRSAAAGSWEQRAKI